jgi:tight adherence protein C
MTPIIPLWLIGLFAAVLIGAALILWRAVEREDRVRVRISRIMNPEADSGVNIRGQKPASDPFDLVVQFGTLLLRSGILPEATRRELEHSVSQAGFRGTRVVGMFIGSKVLLMLALPTLAYFLVVTPDMPVTHKYLWLGGAFAVGMLAPDYIIKQIRGAHLKQVEKGLPDALDMMVICAQAGLGLETAIDRVAQEFASANVGVATELAICANEMRIGTDRRTALLALGDRTGLDNMRRLAGTLIQTMQFGTPLSQALRVLAAEMRMDMLTKFEERAARLPVFMTFPMIIFILPCVFLIIGGPAVLRIGQAFSGVGH